MDKRGNKLHRTLQMAMLRIQDSDTLQRIEIKAGERSLVLKVDPDQPQLLHGGEARVALKDLPSFLGTLVNAEARGSIRFIQRGTLVNLELFPRDVKMSISTLEDPASGHQKQVEFGTRQQFIQAQEAMELLQALDIASPEGKVRADRRRKYYQVDRFVELVDQILGDEEQERSLVILDCGCGKSYLSFVLNYWLTEKRRIPCKIIGIDGNAKVIEASRRIQHRLNYRNMEFLVSSIRDYRPRERVDMVLSLHACDTATDEALALGLYLDSKYIISVPCCQAALRERIDYTPWQGVARHNIFRNRLSDVLTDGLRTAALQARGYKVSVVEYVSPLDTPKNIMIRAVAGAGRAQEAEYRQLQSLVEGMLPLEAMLQILNNR